MLDSSAVYNVDWKSLSVCVQLIYFTVLPEDDSEFTCLFIISNGEVVSVRAEWIFLI